MKNLIVILLLFYSSLCSAQSNTSERDMLMKSLEETLRPGMLKIIKQAFGGTYSRLLEPDKKLNPDVTPDKWNEITIAFEAEVEKNFSKPSALTNLIARVLAQDLTNDEIHQVIAFLSSDAGKKYSVAGERMGKVFYSEEGLAMFSHSLLNVYSAKADLLENKYGLKVAPMPLQAR